MKCKNSLSPSWSLCVLLSFILIAISYHMLDSIFLARKCSLWRKFKSHKISLFFLTLYMLLECYVCAVWILKHKYALHYKAFWLNAQDFPFLAPSLYVISFCGSFSFAFDVWVGKNFIWLPQIAIFSMRTVYFLVLLLLLACS